MTGSCLCGAIAFESTGAVIDFAFDHCSRCRKATGSAFFAEILVELAGFRWSRGASEIRTYEAPVRERPPGYRRDFCATCGGAVPIVHAARGLVIVPAGIVDDDPGARPQRHIFVDVKADWFQITDDLPQAGRK